MDKRQRESAVESVQNMEAIINEGLRMALAESSPDRSLEVLLAHLGKALDGERTYIFEQNKSGGDDNTYEWVADGVLPEKQNLQNLPPKVCGGWYRKFREGGYIAIRDLEEIRQSDPLQYEILKRQNIHSIVAVPLYDDSRLIGFYGVDNPPVKSMEYTSNMLQITAHFIVSSLRLRNLIRERQLEERRKLEDILEGARIGIWTIELEEGCEPRMYGDRTMRMLLGVSEEIGPEECYQSWFRNIDADYVDAVQETVQELLKNGRSEVVYPWMHPTLGKIYVRCGGVLSKKYTKPGACLSGYHQDITETMVTRKKQEQAIMELLEKVRRANSAKSEFLSHMSHDLRTPINGILGMLMIMENSPDDLEKQRECRENIRVSTEHLLSLVNDVLEVSRLESGRAALAEEPFDLNETLRDCITILSSHAEKSDIRLVLEEVKLRHSRLVGSPMHLKQILINIVENAINFNRPGGSVFVRVKETACRNGIAEYQFVVEDNGIGIREEFKKHIFEPFMQENQGARTDYNGVGLGLSIVKKLVEQMDGTIDVESTEREGSVFRVILPIRVDGEWKAHPAAEERNIYADISGTHVLLVEDNELNCEIVKFILEQAGATVMTAENGKDAVERFAASKLGTVDCVLMDLMMPVMSGYEAARVIRGMDRADAKIVPIIALSANAFEEDVAMAKDAGMNEHLMKPVDMEKLFRVMRRLIFMENRDSAKDIRTDKS